MPDGLKKTPGGAYRFSLVHAHCRRTIPYHQDPLHAWGGHRELGGESALFRGAPYKKECNLIGYNVMTAGIYWLGLGNIGRVQRGGRNR